MYDTGLPWQIGTILSALGTIGTLFFAGIALERLIKDKNKKGILQASIATGLIYIVFAVPIWYRVYIQWGSDDLIALIALSIIPLWGFAIGGIKGYQIAAYCLAGVYVIYAIVRVMIAIL